MSPALVTLLIHEADVPPAARAELSAALRADPDRRTWRLETAAVLIAGAIDLAPAEARALVGLSPQECPNVPIANS